MDNKVKKAIKRLILKYDKKVKNVTTLIHRQKERAIDCRQKGSGAASEREMAELNTLCVQRQAYIQASEDIKSMLDHIYLMDTF